jgi:hypothetical protein
VVACQLNEINVASTEPRNCFFFYCMVFLMNLYHFDHTSSWVFQRSTCWGNCTNRIQVTLKHKRTSGVLVMKLRYNIYSTPRSLIRKPVAYLFGRLMHAMWDIIYLYVRGVSNPRNQLRGVFCANKGRWTLRFRTVALEIIWLKSAGFLRGCLKGVLYAAALSDVVEPQHRV